MRYFNRSPAYGVLGVFFLSLLTSTLFFSDFTLAYYFGAWNKGPAGYELSVLEAEKDEKPLLLYFYVEDSRWCDKFNDEYLAAYDVEDFLSKFPKAAVNANEGDAEARLAESFGVTNFPAFFVLIPEFDIKPERIHPFSEKGNMSVSDFLKRIKDIMTSHYNQKAYSYFEDKDYENAIKYFEYSLKIAPEDVYTYYAIGNIYHHIGIDEKDRDILRKAEEYYLKALEIDPKHEQSENELATLRKDMKNM